jgi:hypothetical protein
MSDPFGNYQAHFDTPPTPPAGGISMVLSGTGAPASTLGSNGFLYVNLSTGDLYVKTNGAWTLFSGGGGGGGGLSGTGSPVGVVTPTAAGVSYVDLTDVNAIHVWFSTGILNTSWNQII